MQTKKVVQRAALVVGWPTGAHFNAGTGSRGSIVLPGGMIVTVPSSVARAISTSLERWMNSLDISLPATAKKPSKNYSRSKEKRSSTRGKI